MSQLKFSASKEATHFLSQISLEKILTLVGNEELKMLKTSGSLDTLSGTYSINISHSHGPFVKISQTSSFEIDNTLRNRYLVCILSNELNVTEMHMENHIKMKLHIIKEFNLTEDSENTLVIGIEYLIDGRQQSYTTHKLNGLERHKYLFPGQRMLLLKLLASGGTVPPNLKFIELDDTNAFVTSEYVDLGRWKVKLDEQVKDIMGIERRLYNENFTQISRFFFDDNGALLLRIEPGSEVFGVSPRLKSYDSLKSFFANDVNQKQIFNHEKDLEMQSILGCIKERLDSDFKKYLYKNADWVHLISDYLQQILIDKPENVLEYSREYFLGKVEMNDEEK